MVQIVPRQGWGAAYQIPGGRHVSPAQRRQVVLHWPGGGVGNDPAAYLRSIERQHRVDQGWAAAPGYNWAISRDGRIWEGCGRDVRGIHVGAGNINTTGWGVLVMVAPGETPPTPALQATRALYNWLCTVADRPLAMSWHGEHMATECPGPQLRDWVRRGMPLPLGPTTPQPEKDWFTDVATEQDLARIVRAEVVRALNEGTAAGQQNWGSTNRAILTTLQTLWNRMNEIGGQLANLAARVDRLK